MTVKLLDPDNFFIQVDIAFAREYGVNEAMMAGKLKLLQNNLSGKVDEDGNKWIRLTLDEWEKEVPLKQRTIRRTIDSLIGQDIFFERTFTGRSKWYRLNPIVVSGQSGHIEEDTTGQNGQIQLAKMDTSTGQNGQLPILSSKIDPILEERDTLPEKPLMLEFTPKVQSLLRCNPLESGIKILPLQIKQVSELSQWLIIEVKATIKQVEAAIVYFAWMDWPPTIKQVKEGWAAICTKLRQATKHTKSKQSKNDYIAPGLEAIMIDVLG